MPFPIQPAPNDDEKEFLIQDPFGLRQVVIPMFEADKNTGYMAGLGTGFRIDPFGQFLTAQHVLEDYFESKTQNYLVGMLSPGLIYGRAKLPDNCFVFVDIAKSEREKIDDPLAALQGKVKTKNSFDCMKFSFRKENRRLQDIQNFVPARLQGRIAKKGDRVMAVGFPKLECEYKQSGNLLSLSEQMYGSIGRITDVYPEGRQGNPWPVFEVDVHWPSGMSGGPVLNEDGEAIGLVSSSYEKGSEITRSYAFWFQARDLTQWLHTLDPLNPGWIRGWAVIQENTQIIRVFTRDWVQAQRYRIEYGDGYEVRYVSYRYGSNEFVYQNHNIIAPLSTLHC